MLTSGAPSSRPSLMPRWRRRSGTKIVTPGCFLFGGSDGVFQCWCISIVVLSFCGSNGSDDSFDIALIIEHFFTVPLMTTITTSDA